MTLCSHARGAKRARRRVSRCKNPSRKVAFIRAKRGARRGAAKRIALPTLREGVGQYPILTAGSR
jgi:hypothetical protein